MPRKHDIDYRSEPDDYTIDDTAIKWYMQLDSDDAVQHPHILQTRVGNAVDKNPDSEFRYKTPTTVEQLNYVYPPKLG